MPDLGIGELLAGTVIGDALAGTAAGDALGIAAGAGVAPGVAGGALAADVGDAAALSGAFGGTAGAGESAFGTSLAGGSGLTGAFGGEAGAGESAAMLGSTPTQANLAGDIGTGILKSEGINSALNLARGQNPVAGAGTAGLVGGLTGGLGSATDLGGGGSSMGAPVGGGAPAPGSDILGATTPAGRLSAMTSGVQTGAEQGLAGGTQVADLMTGGAVGGDVAPVLGGQSAQNIAGTFDMSPAGAPKPFSSVINADTGAPLTSGASPGLTDRISNLFTTNETPVGMAPAAATGANAAATGAAGAASSPSIASQIASTVLGGSPNDATNQIVGKGLSVLPAAGALGYTALAGEQAPKGSAALASEAAQMQQQGQAMSNYLSTGTLPPGLQTALQTASEGAKATIRSRYAQQGQSGSSAEAQDLAAVDARMAGQGAQLALQMYQAGVSEEGAAAQLQESLLNNTIQQDQAFTTALGQFTSALAGGGSPLGTVQLKVT